MNPPGIPPNYVQNDKGEWCHPDRLTVRAVGGLLPEQPKRELLPALGSKKAKRDRSKGSVVVRVTIIRCGSRSLDDDNLSFAYKHFRDAISASLGIDDADKRICFEYGQVETKGRRGTIVRIERA